MQLHFEIKIFLSALTTMNWNKYLKNILRVEHSSLAVFIWIHFVVTQARKGQMFSDIPFMNKFPEG